MFIFFVEIFFCPFIIQFYVCCHVADLNSLMTECAVKGIFTDFFFFFKLLMLLKIIVTSL